MTFGTEQEGIRYEERRAAYAVVLGEGGTVASVRGPDGSSFLPGGGSKPGEAPEATLAREVGEELARGVTLLRKIGVATQYFYAPSDDRHFKMTATFYVAEFSDESGSHGEHDLCWLPITSAEGAFFHECHAWAVRQA